MRHLQRSRTHITSIKSPMQLNREGFTLLEILITLALITILVTMAVPSYRTSTLKSQQLNAKMNLMQLALDLEEYRLKLGTYEGFIYNHDLDENYLKLEVTKISPNQFQIKAQIQSPEVQWQIILDQDGNETTP
jgi:type IV pilus assembly protein PilE